MRRLKTTLGVVAGLALAIAAYRRSASRPSGAPQPVAGARTSAATTRASGGAGTRGAGDTTTSVAKGLGDLVASIAGRDSASPGDEGGRVARPPAPPPERGTPELPAGLSIGGDCPPPPAEAKDTAPSLVPLTAGLTLAHVWKPNSDEEYECLLQVTGVTAAYADVTYTCDHRENIERRRLCLADLHDSHFYLTEAGEDLPPVISGTTMFSLSTRSFQELKTTRNTPHRYIEVLNGWQNLKHPLRKDSDGHLHSGRFDRDTIPIAVNDRIVNLPVLTGLAFTDTRRQTSLTVLDNERLPLVLDYSVISEGFRLRYTKISFPSRGELEQRLASDKHVDVYGIYFTFASDRLRPESAPVLAEIAGVLAKHSGWKLSINGHTDNIGGDASNFALSRRRSDAVRKALIERYHIDPARLVTAGYGAAQPKESNETPEGRSRNRRVELVRQ